ncbi:hypothetical protein [Streptomyces sp. NPDC054834]
MARLSQRHASYWGADPGIRRALMSDAIERRPREFVALKSDLLGRSRFTKAVVEARVVCLEVMPTSERSAEA